MIHQNRPENNVAQFSWSIFRYAPQISVPKSKCGPKVSEKHPVFALWTLLLSDRNLISEAYRKMDQEK